MRGVKASPEVEAWLELTVGNSWCVDRLFSFVSVLGTNDQVRIKLRWVGELVLGNIERVASRNYMRIIWVIGMRAAAADAGSLTKWHRVVVALVVAVEIQLAPYSV